MDVSKATHIFYWVIIIFLAYGIYYNGSSAREEGKKEGYDSGYEIGFEDGYHEALDYYGITE